MPCVYPTYPRWSLHHGFAVVVPDSPRQLLGQWEIVPCVASAAVPSLFRDPWSQLTFPMSWQSVGATISNTLSVVVAY